jgi:hypothetical protein
MRYVECPSSSYRKRRQAARSQELVPFQGRSSLQRRYRRRYAFWWYPAIVVFVDEVVVVGRNFSPCDIKSRISLWDTLKASLHTCGLRRQLLFVPFQFERCFTLGVNLLGTLKHVPLLSSYETKILAFISLKV